LNVFFSRDSSGNPRDLERFFIAEKERPTEGPFMVRKTLSNEKSLHYIYFIGVQ
jgi:hypothetical protein